MRSSRMKTTILFLAIPLLTGGLSAFLSREGMKAFQSLRQPSWAPPMWLFPVVWTLLYLLMGYGAARVWNTRRRGRGDAVFLFGAQLFVNFWWSIFFFAWGVRLFAFFWLLLLIVLVLAMLLSFKTLDATAARLNIPYLLWLVLAAWLNMSVYLLNK